jgi:hypothetical protein
LPLSRQGRTRLGLCSLELVCEALSRRLELEPQAFIRLGDDFLALQFPRLGRGFHILLRLVHLSLPLLLYHAKLTRRSHLVVLSP